MKCFFLGVFSNPKSSMGCNQKVWEKITLSCDGYNLVKLPSQGEVVPVRGKLHYNTTASSRSEYSGPCRTAPKVWPTNHAGWLLRTCHVYNSDYSGCLLVPQPPRTVIQWSISVVTRSEARCSRAFNKQQASHSQLHAQQHVKFKRSTGHLTSS